MSRPAFARSEHEAHLRTKPTAPRCWRSIAMQSRRCKNVCPPTPVSAVPIVPNEISARIKSHHLGNERTVWVHPPRHSDARHLVIFLDGELYREKVGAIDVIQSLLDRREIADAWFVFVSMESVESRWRECPCFPPFPHFMVEELLPWLEKQFPPIARVSQRTLAGLSYTGLAAAYVEWARPGVFHRI